MLSEAIETIKGLAVDAADVQIKKAPGDETKVLICHGGEFVEREVPPPLRNHKIARIEDLCKYAQEAAAADWDTPRPSFWHSDAAIVALLSDDDRRDVVSLALEASPQWKRLQSLVTPQGLNQKALLRLLKVDFDGCLENPTLIEIFREVKFRSSAFAGGTVQHGRESLGHEIEGQVTGAGALPEELTVNVSVYRNPDLEEFIVHVRLAVEIDYGTNEFSLTPFPDELHKAQQFLHEQIRQTLAAMLPEGTPIVQGTP